LLSPKTSPRELSGLLGTSYSKLCYVVYGVGVQSLYSQFSIVKKTGGRRFIHAPFPILKYLQFKLKPLLDNLYKPHPAATAFIKSRGIVYNASYHVKKAAVFNIDLEDYYGAINFGRIRGMLVAHPYCLRHDTAQLIAHICCVNQVLPQGAPTSPTISNMVSIFLDKKLSYLAKKNRAFYTRYADDITFSFRSLAENEIYLGTRDAQVHPVLIDTIVGCGFTINSSKTRLSTYKERQVVTGLKVNRKVNIDRRFIRTTRAMTHSLMLGVEAANQKYQIISGNNEKKLEYVVFGRINYIGMVKGVASTVYQSLAGKFNALGLEVKVNTAPRDIEKMIAKKLYFMSGEDRWLLEATVWVVTFEGVGGLGDGEFVQGTAFMLKGNRLISTAHTFNKASNSDRCFVHRVGKKIDGKKYCAQVVRRCDNTDIAELRILSDVNTNFPYLDLSKEFSFHPGYKVSMVGYPEYMLGHDSVSISILDIVNTLTISGVDYGEVSGLIRPGNSGGPVLNAYMQVVGLVARGTAVSSYDGDTVLEGMNAYISVKHFEPNILNSIYSSVQCIAHKNYISVGEGVLCRACYERGEDRHIIPQFNAFFYCFKCDRVNRFE